MKIVTIVGARPQFVKAAVVSRALMQYSGLQEIIVHTGQHYDANMSDIFFEEMCIPRPAYSLGIGGSTHGAMTGQMLGEIESVLFKEKPDVILVYGDTNSTLAGALAAAKLHIPVAHVEAGLRSFNMNMPEEINRILTDRVSKWLFCPTQTAVHNLRCEGVREKNARNATQVINVGDVMYDAVLFYQKIAKASKLVSEMLEKFYEGFYLATIHRAENTDVIPRLRNILSALEQISINMPIVLPLHPRTAKIMQENGLGTSNIQIVPPLGYFDMLLLLQKCHGVFTDSGGLQKEAYFSNKFCVTLRDETEWVELITGGFNCLAGAEFARIIQAENGMRDKTMHWEPTLYGNGDAGEKIALELARA